MWSIDDPDLSENLRKVRDRVDELVGGDDRVGLLVTDSSADPSQDGIVSVGVELIKPVTDGVKDVDVAVQRTARFNFTTYTGVETWI